MHKQTQIITDDFFRSKPTSTTADIKECLRELERITAGTFFLPELENNAGINGAFGF